MKSALALLPVVALLAACGERSPPPSVAESGPRLVRTLVIGAASLQEDNRYSGEVRARYETTLGFRVGGKMVERLADAGARVKSGQALARLDPADARLAASQADANRALAAAELKRTQDLKTRNFVSQAALDAKATTAQAADAQAQLARNQAAYTTLFADATGVVAAVLAEPGQVVGAGQGVLRLARDGEREVAIALPEAALAGLKPGSQAAVRLWADGQAYPGRIREIAPAADAVTRTFAARVSIVGAPADLPLGLTATVSFPRPGGERIVVPLAAIFQQGERPAVWVLGKDNAVALRPVEIERYGDAGVVLQGGLNAGERIVAAGAFKLTAGEKVRPADEPRR
jgi:membrane fusion protein, multidrug efflux system